MRRKDIVRHAAPASFGAGFEPIFSHADVWFVDNGSRLGLAVSATSGFPFKDRPAEFAPNGDDIFRLYKVLRVCNRVSGTARRGR
jgi:hypothetical protein